MQFHVNNENASVNGGAINGRGVKHLKLTRQERISQAADVATGEKQIDLSLGQICLIFNVTPAALRAELRHVAFAGTASRRSSSAGLRHGTGCRSLSASRRSWTSANSIKPLRRRFGAARTNASGVRFTKPPARSAVSQDGRKSAACNEHLRKANRGVS